MDGQNNIAVVNKIIVLALCLKYYMISFYYLHMWTPITPSRPSPPKIAWEAHTGSPGPIPAHPGPPGTPKSSSSTSTGILYHMTTVVCTMVVIC